MDINRDRDMCAALDTYSINVIIVLAEGSNNNDRCFFLLLSTEPTFYQRLSYFKIIKFGAIAAVYADWIGWELFMD